MAGISFIDVLNSLVRRQDWDADLLESRLTFGEFQNMLLTEDYTSCLRKQRELWNMMLSQGLGRDVTINKRGAMSVMIMNVPKVLGFIQGAKIGKK